MLTACSLAWRSALMRSASANESSSISKAEPTITGWVSQTGTGIHPSTTSDSVTAPSINNAQARRK